MCTINMTFEVPETKHVNIEALKKQMYSYLEYILSMPSLATTEDASVTKHHWAEEFRGQWRDDNMTAEKFVREIRENRESRKIVEI